MEASGSIDGEHVLFTEAELRRAFGLVVPAEEAQRVVAEIVGIVRTTDEMAREAEAARARGSTDPDEITPAALRSADVRARERAVATGAPCRIPTFDHEVARAYMARWRAGRTRRLRPCVTFRRSVPRS